MNNLNEAMQLFFDELNIDPIEFNYIEDQNLYISKNSFSYDDSELMEYYIVIKVFNNIGTVSIGQSDGITYNEYKTLGQIMYDGSKWINI